jgi:hypothetical protein
LVALNPAVEEDGLVVLDVQHHRLLLLRPAVFRMPTLIAMKLSPSTAANNSQIRCIYVSLQQIAPCRLFRKKRRGSWGIAN